MATMSFSPSDDQRMLVDAINKYVTNDVRKIAHDADESGELPANVLRKAWGLGILPAAMPEQFGGMGEYSAVTNVLAAEELAYGDLSLAMAVMAPALIGVPVVLGGTDQRKSNMLPGLAPEK